MTDTALPGTPAPIQRRKAKDPIGAAKAHIAKLEAARDEARTKSDAAQKAYEAALDQLRSLSS